jgi:hypothetical protein
MGANAGHHEPGLPAFGGPVLVGRRGGIIEIGVAGDRVWEVVDRHGLRLCNLLVCPVADEDRLLHHKGFDELGQRAGSGGTGKSRHISHHATDCAQLDRVTNCSRRGLSQFSGVTPSVWSRSSKGGLTPPSSCAMRLAAIMPALRSTSRAPGAIADRLVSPSMSPHSGSQGRMTCVLSSPPSLSPE